MVSIDLQAAAPGAAAVLPELPSPVASLALHKPTLAWLERFAKAMGAPSVPARQGPVHAMIPLRRPNDASLGALVSTVMIR